MIAVANVLGPILVAVLYIAACSFFQEPNRRNFNAIMIAGAGAAYLNGGFGIWEFAFTAVVTYFAYRGLRSYNFIGIGWFFHTGWDVIHHLYGNPIVPFVPASSLGCAICDPVIAIWCFAGSDYSAITCATTMRTERTSSSTRRRQPEVPFRHSEMCGKIIFLQQHSHGMVTPMLGLN